MTAFSLPTGVVRQAPGNADQHFPRILLVCCWVLIFATFSMPGRLGPSDASALDWIAILKLGVRVTALGILALFALARWRTPERRVVALALTPLFMFAAWGVLSAAWSPLKAVTLGQVSGLIVLILLASNIGLWGRDPQASSGILCSLSWALLLFSGVILIFAFIDPNLGSTDRLNAGLIHPSGMAASSSVGLLLLWLCRLLWGWAWTKRLIVPGTVVYVSVILLAASRTTLVANALVIGLALLLYARRGLVYGIVFSACLVAAGYLTLDPALSLCEAPLEKVAEYVERDDSSSVSELSGRVELWGVIWESFLESPWMGHGYFVSSSTGELYAWHAWANFTAHNVVLQALVTTGVIGTSLIFLGLAWPYFLMLGYGRSGVSHGRNIARMVTLFGIWYFIWGQMNASFLGPLAPESVVFYTLLGLVLTTLPITRDQPAIEPRYPRVRSSRRLGRPTFREYC